MLHAPSPTSYLSTKGPRGYPGSWCNILTIPCPLITGIISGLLNISRYLWNTSKQLYIFSEASSRVLEWNTSYNTARTNKTQKISIKQSRQEMDTAMRNTSNKKHASHLKKTRECFCVGIRQSTRSTVLWTMVFDERVKSS